MEGASLFLMQDLLSNPQELYNPILLQVLPLFPFMILINPQIRYASRLVLKISHGYDVVTPDDKLIEIAERSLAQIGHAFELGRFMVEFFPFRECTFTTGRGTLTPSRRHQLVKYIPEWFPGTGWKRTAAEYKASTEEMVHVPHEMVKRQLVSNPECICEEFDRRLTA